MARETATDSRGRRAGEGWTRYAPWIVLGTGTVVALSLLSPAVWPVLLTDGLYALAVVAAAAGWGAWPAVALKFGRRPAGQQFCVAAALGFGVLSTIVLVLGVAGCLGRATAWGLVATGGVLGVVRLWRAQTDRVDQLAVAQSAPSDAPRRRYWFAIALLPLCVPIAVSLFGASLPPGILWNGEARGYDALEYHLEVPREYFDRGQIEFLPHNVYASFPQQVESLYLLLMHLIGSPLRAAIPAQLLHAAFGILTVVTLAAWCKPGWPRVWVALVAGSVPWLAYLGCLAYVELGLLFFAAVAACLTIESERPGADGGWQTALTAGLCAGLAGGCKYLGIALVAVALGIAWLLLMRVAWRVRARRAAWFGAGVVIALSPWLIRNAALTGNPVYPFAYRWFGGVAWSAEQDAQWARGHALSPDKASLAGRLGIVADELPLSGLYGPALWAAALGGILLARTRGHAIAAIWLVLIVAIWATATHMPGRFAVPIVLPLTLLVALGLTAAPRPSAAAGIALRKVGLAVVAIAAVVGGCWNDATLLRLLRGENDRLHGLLRDLVGLPEVWQQQYPINQVIQSPDAYVWLIGDAAVFYLKPRVHYTVVFSRDPWLQYAASGATPAQCVAWLRTAGATHVVFSWREIDRLRQTYGFAPQVTPAWVEQLEAAGLHRVRPADEAAADPKLAIYEVPRG